MVFSRRWSVESKEFELVIVGGETGVRLREICRGRLRSILMDRDEIAWLVRIFEELVEVEDSRVFWNQALAGFPRIIAQRCFNRHGGFLTIEEYNGGRRRDAVLVPEGRRGKGWDLFGSALQSVVEQFSVRGSGVAAFPESQAMRGSRRSYAEVLSKSLPPLEENLGECSGPVARVPEWVKDLLKGVSTDKFVRVPVSSRSLSGERIQFPATGNLAPVKLSNVPEKALTSSCGPTVSNQQGVMGEVASDSRHRHLHFGESLELLNLRETLLKLHVDIGVCLEKLDLVEDGLVGKKCCFSH
jgi:hypothetical protein